MEKGFNYIGFYGGILNTMTIYGPLLPYMVDEKALFTHTKSLYEMENNKSFDLLSEKEQQDKYDIVSGDIMFNGELIIINMVVVVATIIEMINRDFFYFVFLTKPEKLKYCLVLKDRALLELGFSVDEFLKYKTKSDYIKVLCQRASTMCNSGPITKIIKRMKDLTKINIDAQLTERIVELYEIRNNYIHEHKQREIDIDIFEKLVNAAFFYLKRVTRKMMEYNVMIISPDGFLNELMEDEHVPDIV